MGSQPNPWWAKVAFLWQGAQRANLQSHLHLCLCFSLRWGSWIFSSPSPCCVWSGQWALHCVSFESCAYLLLRLILNADSIPSSVDGRPMTGTILPRHWPRSFARSAWAVYCVVPHWSSDHDRWRNGWQSSCLFDGTGCNARATAPPSWRLAGGCVWSDSSPLSDVWPTYELSLSKLRSVEWCALCNARTRLCERQPAVCAGVGAMCHSTAESWRMSNAMITSKNTRRNEHINESNTKWETMSPGLASSVIKVIRKAT